MAVTDDYGNKAAYQKEEYERVGCEGRYFISYFCIIWKCTLFMYGVLYVVFPHTLQAG